MTQMEQLEGAIVAAIAKNPGTDSVARVYPGEIAFVLNDVQYVCEVKRVVL